MDEYGIYSIDFGNGIGHEQSYSRPAILFKDLHDLGLALVIPLTSKLIRLNLPYTIQINRDQITNLKENSVALIFQLRAISCNRIKGNKIGSLDEISVKKIKTVITEMLDL